MDKKTRLIILCICFILFLVVTPYIVLYSLGYRIDFQKRKIAATGGIYIKVLPSAIEVVIDNKINKETGFLSNDIFVQNLLPKDHKVTIKKEGYYEYNKTLPVKENEVTKLEHVILIKQKIIFDSLENNIDYFSISPDGNKLLLAKYILSKEDSEIHFEIINLLNQNKQNFSLNRPDKKPLVSDIKWSDNSSKALLSISDNYFLINLSLQNPETTPLPFLTDSKEASFNPQEDSQLFFIKNKNLYSSKQPTSPIIKNVISYQITNQSITWLSQDGFLYKSDIEGSNTNKVTLDKFIIKKSGLYKIKIISGNLFLQEDESLFWLNQKSQTFESFYGPVKDLKTSPDSKKVLYCNDHEALFSFLNSNNPEKVFLNRFSEKISDCYWLNDAYIILEAGNKIIISEIDIRDNINTIILPDKLSLSNNDNIDIKNLKIVLNQQDNKLYILTQGNLLVSERLIP